MADPIDDAIANAQKQAFQAVPSGGGTVVPIRSALSQIPAGPVCVSVEEFLADTESPAWVIHGLLQSGMVFALTAPTNHGKTAVSLVAALCVASGKPFACRPVIQGGVLILCGENQDGFRLRMLATMESLGITMADIKGRMWVLPQSNGLAYLLEQIKKDAGKMGNLSMVLVDTSVSFFTGDNENDNTQAYNHARDLRELAELPGKPAVLVNCHPAAGAGKDMTRESCVPRGGGAFLNEIDTNLSVWSEGETAELHWTRKKRGPDFTPILFEYKGKTMRYQDQDVPTIVAVHIDEDREKEMRIKRKEAESRLIYAMNANPNGTIREWARESGFLIRSGRNQGDPHTSFTVRALERLKHYKLAERSPRDGWVLTAAGKKEAESIR